MLSQSAILDHFSFIDDPRNRNSVLYPLDELLIISICAAICGFTGYSGMAGFAEDKEDRLRKFLPMKYGVPSHDTFRRMFCLVEASQFELAFIRWTRHAAELTKGAVVAIDGKTVRGSASKAESMKAIHIVSAWASETNLSLKHIKVDDKSNEIIAILELLDLLYVKGCIVTIDAMGCQKEIAEKIVAKGAGFALAIKANQPKLKDAAEKALVFSQQNKAKSREKLRGREEIGRAFVSEVPKAIVDLGWKTATHIDVVKATHIVNGDASYEDRFYLLRGVSTPDELLRVSREHIENKFHWVLDVVMGEDACQVTDKNGARNLATLGRIAINKLKLHQGKMSMRRCQSRAALKDSFREAVLAQI